MNQQQNPSFGKSALKEPAAEKQTFRVATWNLENYLDATAKKGCIKSAESKAKIRQCIREMAPDVLALQEVGSLNMLHELRDSLAAEGRDFPEWEYIEGADADLHIAVCSRFPFSRRQQHTVDAFQHRGAEFRVRRGFAELEIQVNAAFSFTLFVAHLKSKNENAKVLAGALRLEEARILRAKVETSIAGKEGAKIIICGDFNDTEDSDVMATIVGNGKDRLVDARPKNDGGEVAWTNFYEAINRYDRIDYVLMSQSAANCLVPGSARVWQTPDWRLASDHRPIAVDFFATKKGPS